EGTMQSKLCAGLTLVVLAFSIIAESATEKATVIGNVNLESKETKVDWIYSQRREAAQADLDRFKMGQNEKLEGGVIDIFATNKEINEKTMQQILDNKYYGSGIRGVWLLIDCTQKHSYLSYFLTQTGAVLGATGTYQESSDGKVEIKKGKMNGKLEYRVQQVTKLFSYSVLFDMPLILRPYETQAASVSAEQSESVLPGKWSIERWWDENGGSTAGTLTIDMPNEGKLAGTFHFLYKDTEYVEDVAITRSGTKIHFEGSVPDGSKWIPD